MNYQQERDEFIATMSQAGLPISAIRKVLARANTLQRNAELSCSSEAADRDRVPCPAIRPGKDADCCCDRFLCECGHSINQHANSGSPCDDCDCTKLIQKHESVPRIDRQSHRIGQELKALLEPKGFTVDSYGDPRGCVLKLKRDNREYGVPSKGLPASFWKRNR